MNQDKMKILVVDDEQLVRWFMERALKKWGHNVTSVANTRDAMNYIQNGTYDILFTDLRMPEGNGSHLVKKVCEMPSTNLKIVVCSAFITTEMANDFNKKGILTLKKPFKLADLESTLGICEKDLGLS
jgi:DNA-binding NtrC family response regulator